MGAWGTGIFENDSALDFVYELTLGTSLEPLQMILDEIASLGDEQLDAGLASMMLAAGEMIATSKGRGGKLPADLAEWMKTGPAIGPEMQTAVRAAIQLTLDDSELRDLWDGSQDYAAWQAEVEGLLARIST